MDIQDIAVRTIPAKALNAVADESELSGMGCWPQARWGGGDESPRKRLGVCVDRYIAVANMIAANTVDITSSFKWSPNCSLNELLQLQTGECPVLRSDHAPCV